MAFLASALGAELAAQLLRLALLWRATELHGSTSSVAGILFGEAAVALLLGLLCGPLLDRGDPRRYALFCCAWRAVAGLGFLWAPDLSSLALAAAVFALGDGLYVPARSTQLARLTSDETLLELNAQVGAAQGLSLLLGPLLFVAARTWGGATALFGTLSILQALAGALLLFTPRSRAVADHAVPPYRQELRNGLGHLAQAGPLRACLWVFTLGVFFASALYPLLPAVAVRIHAARPDAALGAIVVGLGLGGLLGALLAPRLITRLGAGRTVLLSTAADGVGFAALLLPRSPALAALVSLAWGAVMIVSMVALTTLLQRESPARWRGQVLALLSPLQGAGVVASYLAVAVLAPLIPAPALVLGGGAGLLLTGLGVALTPSGRALSAAR